MPISAIPTVQDVVIIGSGAAGGMAAWKSHAPRRECDYARRGT